MVFPARFLTERHYLPRIVDTGSLFEYPFEVRRHKVVQVCGNSETVPHASVLQLRIPCKPYHHSLIVYVESLARLKDAGDVKQMRFATIIDEGPAYPSNMKPARNTILIVYRPSYAGT